MTQSFDEWFLENGIPMDTDFNVASRAYQAGQKSRQSEIDELQKRIDDAVKCMEQNKPSFPMDYKHAMDALSILKGNQDD